MGLFGNPETHLALKATELRAQNAGIEWQEIVDGAKRG